MFPIRAIGPASSLTAAPTSDQPTAVTEAAESDLEKAIEGLGLDSKTPEAATAKDKKQTLAELAASSSASTSTNTLKRQVIR